MSKILMALLPIGFIIIVTTISILLLWLPESTEAQDFDTKGEYQWIELPPLPIEGFRNRCFRLELTDPDYQLIERTVWCVP